MCESGVGNVTLRSRKCDPKVVKGGALADESGAAAVEMWRCGH